MDTTHVHVVQSPNRRIFLICNTCNHHVKKSLERNPVTVPECRCICHRPDMAHQEKILNYQLTGVWPL